MSTLANIRTKVRRLTGRPSPNQITDADIDDYINTFYIFDMPETLRLFTQKSVFEFMTTANVADYDLTQEQVWTGVENVPAVDLYITLGPPAYVAGYQAFYSQNREQFFRVYPELATITTSVTGDGTPGPYAVTVADSPLVPGLVTAGAIDDTDTAVNVIDVATDRTAGAWQQINTNTTITGSINYITGALSVTFPNNIPTGNEVTFTSVPYVASRPLAMLFFNNTLTLRPIPDKSYLVQLNAYKRPTKMIDAAEYPELRQWWQYLAYGAAKKIFEDSQDPEGVSAILPGFKEQENMVLRRTIIERTNQRTATIYTEQTIFPYGNFENRF